MCGTTIGTPKRQPKLWETPFSMGICRAQGSGCARYEEAVGSQGVRFFRFGRWCLGALGLEG